MSMGGQSLFAVLIIVACTCAHANGIGKTKGSALVGEGDQEGQCASVQQELWPYFRPNAHTIDSPVQAIQNMLASPLPESQRCNPAICYNSSTTCSEFVCSLNDGANVPVFTAPGSSGRAFLFPHRSRFLICLCCQTFCVLGRQISE